MKWQPKPLSSGEYIIAFKNTANGLKGFRHITIDKTGMWVEPADEQQLVCFGNHMKVVGYAKLSMPKEAK